MTTDPYNKEMKLQQRNGNYNKEMETSVPQQRQQMEIVPTLAPFKFVA